MKWVKEAVPLKRFKGYSVLESVKRTIFTNYTIKPR
jgi:hypothetical protein